MATFNLGNIPSLAGQFAAAKQIEAQDQQILASQIAAATQQERLNQLQSPEAQALAQLEQQLGVQKAQVQLEELRNPEAALQRKIREAIAIKQATPVEVGGSLLQWDPDLKTYKSVFTGPPKVGTEQFVGFNTQGQPLTFTPGRGLNIATAPEGIQGPLLPKTESAFRGSQNILAKYEKTGRLTNVVLGAGEQLQEGFSKYEKPALKTSDPLAFSQSVRKDPVVKEFTEVRTQFDRMRNAIEESKAGGPLTAVDQTLINTFNRILDPDSVVRESEYARTAQDQSVMNYLKGKFDPQTGRLVLGGAGLTPETREGMVKMAERFYNASQQNYGTVIDEYSKLAQAAGLDPDLVLPRVTLPTGAVTPRPTTAPSPVVPSGMIKVAKPDGTTGSIPASNLQNALKAGWKQVP